MKLDFRFSDFIELEHPLPAQPLRSPRDGELNLILHEIRQLIFGRSRLQELKGGREFNRMSKWLRAVENQLVDNLCCQFGLFSVQWPDRRIAVRIETSAFVRNGYKGALRLAIYS